MDVHHQRGRLARSCNRVSLHMAAAACNLHIKPLFPRIAVASRYPRELHNHRDIKIHRPLPYLTKSMPYGKPTSKRLQSTCATHAISHANTPRSQVYIKKRVLFCELPGPLHERRGLVTREDLLTGEGWSGTRVRRRWSGSSRPGSRSQARCRRCRLARRGTSLLRVRLRIQSLLCALVSMRSSKERCNRDLPALVMACRYFLS
jgi:hypothetical protein